MLLGTEQIILSLSLPILKTLMLDSVPLAR